jgi:16S rRNA (cytosine1402-N4)-methyltransferase
MNRPHIPIMDNEVVGFFEGSDLKVFVDGTVGAGGHAKRILEAHPEIRTFIAFDQDPEALAIAKETLSPWKEKVELVHGNFANFDQHLKKRKISAVDGFFLT